MFRASPQVEISPDGDDKQNVKDQAQEATDKTKGFFGSLKDRVAGTADQASDKASEKTSQASEKTSEKNSSSHSKTSSSSTTTTKVRTSIVFALFVCCILLAIA